ncbi:hypothetical protein M3F30_04435 [Corynebacterium sanguinis]|uniref:DnaB-like helicase N-terminal domain-containing protein n=1 Tax=Corynebacterium sanguinis TaxID=2594913 RepID=UPI00223AD98A|nr:DnaB-like helicase N-terminal domain-containing protein [Corynebacterium sanguinis]MCT2287833.1 hypothetical protein [Corynebacterium sanguinis]
MGQQQHLEQALLRGVLATTADTALATLAAITPENFQFPQHQTIAKAIYARAQALSDAQAGTAHIDPAVVMADLVDSGATDTVRTAMIEVSTGNPAAPAELPRLTQALQIATLRAEMLTTGQALTTAADGSLTDVQTALQHAADLTRLATDII